VNTGAYLSYPTSTLSPPISKTDLSPFKLDGISRVERDVNEKLLALKNQYDKLVDDYEWNKIVYCSEINFEPLVGQTYYLYRINSRNVLSLISPTEWDQEYIGSFKLNFDKHWIKQ
jgi:hypothetical protein